MNMKTTQNKKIYPIHSDAEENAPRNNEKMALHLKDEKFASRNFFVIIPLIMAGLLLSFTLVPGWDHVRLKIIWLTVIIIAVYYQLIYLLSRNKRKLYKLKLHILCNGRKTFCEITKADKIDEYLQIELVYGEQMQYRSFGRWRADGSMKGLKKGDQIKILVHDQKEEYFMFFPPQGIPTLAWAKKPAH